jgi:N-acetylneuraminic acid mutarotase
VPYGRILVLIAALSVSQSAEASWREGAPIESARTQVRAAVAGDQIYAGGGASLSGPSDVFESYDPRSDHWLPLESMPEGKDMFGMASVGSTVYVAGGLSTLNKNKPSGTVYSYDTTRSRWQRVADLPSARTGLTLSAVSGRLYAIGGNGSGSDRVLRYDPSSDKWEAYGSPIPSPRNGHASAALGTKIYVVGGNASGGGSLARVDVFDTSNGQWSSAPSLPVAITGLTADFVGTELHIAGGVAASQKRTLTDHYVLASSGWQKRDDMPTPRQGLASAVVGGKWFLIGGGAGNGALAVFTETDAVEIYSP